MSGILTAVRKMSGILLKVRENILSGKSDQKLFIVSCIFASVQVFSSIQLVPACRFVGNHQGTVRDFTVSREWATEEITDQLVLVLNCKNQLRLACTSDNTITDCRMRKAVVSVTHSKSCPPPDQLMTVFMY